MDGGLIVIADIDYTKVLVDHNTKKSYVMLGIEILDKIISDPRRNVLILRNTFASNRYTTYSTLQMLINQPDISDDSITLANYFKFNNVEMTITYKPTGQMILFKGCDDPQKLQGIRTPKGFLTDLYVEEAFEIDDYNLWRKIDGSIRGKLPDGLFHQITFCFNAWSDQHWLYEHFFKGRLEDDYDYLYTHDYSDYKNEDEIIDFGKGIYLHISTYKINEFRDFEVYDLAMEQLMIKAPSFFKVEALGMWGSVGESTYPEWKESLVHKQKEINELQYDSYSLGIDTGLADGEGKVKRGEDVKVRSATTMCLCGLTSDYENLVAIDEYYHSNELQEIMTEPQLIEAMLDKILEWEDRYYYHRVLMKGTICVYVDSASRGFRESMQYRAEQRGMMNVRFIASTKQKIQTRVDFTRLLIALDKLKISELCVNLCREFKNSKHGQKGEVREDIDDHCINSYEYATVVLLPRLMQWHSFKER